MSSDLRHSISSSESELSSPLLSAVDSSAALILVNDEDADVNSPLDFSSDEEDDHFPQQYEVRTATVLPLSPLVVSLYLLVPYLRLGATLLPHSGGRLKYGLPSLLISAGLAGFARQVWFMLARHLRKSDMEEVILDAFARGRGKERQRAALRTVVRTGTGILRILLAATYLHGQSPLLSPS